MSATRINPSTVAPPSGLFSHAMMAPGTGRWLHVSGQIGVDAGGTLAPGFKEQAHQAWANLMAILKDADMDASNLVKVTTFLTDPADLATLNPIRSGFLGEARPASTLVVVKALARPEWLIEVEAVAYAA